MQSGVRAYGIRQENRSTLMLNGLNQGKSVLKAEATLIFLFSLGVDAREQTVLSIANTWDNAGIEVLYHV